MNAKYLNVWFLRANGIHSYILETVLIINVVLLHEFVKVCIQLHSL